MFGALLLFLLLFAIPATAQAATAKFTLNGVTKPSTIKKGSFFYLKGTITCDYTMKQVRVMIYDSTGKTCLQKYVAKPNSKTYSLTQADPYIEFDTLSVGKYYYKVQVVPKGASTKTVISKQFSVTGSGSIKIVNPKPSANLTLNTGAYYALGGTINSTYKIAKIVAKIIDSNSKSVYAKAVAPKTYSYSLADSALDDAMLFNKLSAGTYKLKITVTDSQGTSANVIYRTVTVKSTTTNSNSNTTPSSNGGTTNTSGSYLNYNGTVTTPSNFTARTTRPAASNVYYYSGNYNIYYQYNSLAPTGNAYYGSSYVLGNCTWYACGRAMEIVAKAGGSISKVQAIFGGDPVGIYNTNAAKGTFEYGTAPKIGALAIFNYGSSGDAHIAVVENIINGVPYVSESGYSVSTVQPNESKSNIIFKYQSIYNWAGGRSLRGYIYLI